MNALAAMDESERAANANPSRSPSAVTLQCAPTLNVGGGGGGASVDNWTSGIAVQRPLQPFLETNSAISCRAERPEPRREGREGEAGRNRCGGLARASARWRRGDEAIADRWKPDTPTDDYAVRSIKDCEGE